MVFDLQKITRNSFLRLKSVATICSLKECSAKKNNWEEKLACHNKVDAACVKEFSMLY